MTNILLCGGSGTRLWPVSRVLLPKQFVKLFGENSLFQLTIERNSKVCNKKIIVSNQDQYFLALDQLEEIQKEDSTTYLLEPLGRNTAPAITLACLVADPNEIVLITPSDHIIKNIKNYQELMLKAKSLAQSNNIVTFGIKPNYPETGYGYIEAKGEKVLRFKEKPDRSTAMEYIKKGNFYWNSGIFMFKAGFFLEELKKFSPKIYQNCKTALTNTKIDKTIRIKHDDMINIPSDSIDYAVMEKSENVLVLPADIGWSDLGSFDSLYDEMKKDEHLNTNAKKHININSKNNFLFSTQNKVISTIDIDNLIIVDTPDALLVCKKGSSQKVKSVVEKLQKTGDKNLLSTHTIVHRPWGTYEVLLTDSKYKIKRIVVKPGKRLSLQKHFHRNEHWIVVSGTATVTIENDKKLLCPNESTYIKMGELHRLENEGIIPVVLIEAQVGEYTEEDDILRVEDDFLRNENL